MKSRLQRATSIRLALTYLAIIMVMSLGFSAVFYKTSSHELGRQAPPSIGQMHQPKYVYDDGQPGEPNDTTIDTFLANRAREGRHELFMKLVIINVSALCIGGIISYYLARRALRPIEQTMEAQDQFVSDASHELRTPLTAIQASNDVALRNPKLTLSAAKQVIAGNSEEAVKLQQLAAGLLDLAKQDANDLKLIAVNIQDAASLAVNKVIPLAQAKDITIDDQLPPLAAQATESGIVQVLVILLDNAIKYGKQDGHITLAASRKGRYVYLEVRDDGIGIRASDLPHVFRRFYRADSARSDGHRHGYGLGLAIAQTITRQYKGSISVSSEVGVGSTFTAKLLLDH